MVKLKFGQPEHGWLTVWLTIGDEVIEIDASDVPVDPIGLLTEAVATAIAGGEGEAWWHLEPGGFWTTFSAEGEMYRLRVTYAELNTQSRREPMADVTGTFDEIIVPIWRGLSEFEPRECEEFAVPPDSMAAITAAVESRR